MRTQNSTKRDMREQLTSAGNGAPQIAGFQITRTSSGILTEALRDTVQADSMANIPVERMHGMVDALFPIVATVLFAKNFSEIDEEEGELMIESCMHVGDGGDSDECTWAKVGSLMWWGSHGNHQRFDRLMSTCAVFCLVYLDWHANARIFRNLEHVSKATMLIQMLWCIGATVYPITLSPWMMGWESTLGMNLALGQLAFCQLIHSMLVYQLPLKNSVRNMLVAEDLAMIVGLGIMGVVVEVTDSTSPDPFHSRNTRSYYWTMFVLLHACRMVLQRCLESVEGFSLPPWAVKLGRLEFFTDGVGMCPEICYLHLYRSNSCIHIFL